MTTQKRKPAVAAGTPILALPKEFVIYWLGRGIGEAREMFPAWPGSTEELIAELEAQPGEILVPDVGLFTRAEYEEFVREPEAADHTLGTSQSGAPELANTSPLDGPTALGDEAMDGASAADGLLPPAPRSAPTRAERTAALVRKRAEHAGKMLAQAERRLKLAKTIHKRWAEKVRYYERRAGKAS
ncbi:MAG: hypothetical protein HYZ29_17205 [Myxococcales bacterium]|nr:hypothetical protein [Myxococcales bacterium]